LPVQGETPGGVIEVRAGADVSEGSVPGGSYLELIVGAGGVSAGVDLEGEKIVELGLFGPDGGRFIISLYI
jgi:hypothetical protein